MIDSVINVKNFLYYLYKTVTINGQKLTDRDINTLMLIAKYTDEIFIYNDIRKLTKHNDINRPLETLVNLGIIRRIDNLSNNKSVLYTYTKTKHFYSLLRDLTEVYNRFLFLDTSKLYINYSFPSIDLYYK